MNKNTIHIIGGPTASGKSSAAMQLARETNGVIINADSVQIYNALPILTAQPTAQDKAEIPHILYGARDPNDPYSAGNWREDVIPLIENILKNGQTPIICGGTGLYINALMHGLSPMPDIPDHIRKEANETQAKLGNPAFHAELAKIDPVMADRFHAGHTARLIRAYEVIRATGKSLAEWQTLPREKPPEHWVFDLQKIIPERETLYNNCNKRFEIMLENGALDEVAAFAEKIENGTINQGTPATKALGFKELRAYLNGKITKDEAITTAQTATRHYAKRQTTWFRNQL